MKTTRLGATYAVVRDACHMCHEATQTGACLLALVMKLLMIIHEASGNLL